MGSGVGLHIFDAVGRLAHVTVEAPIRITGNATYPARLPLQSAASLLATREARLGWRGNGSDTVMVTAENGTAVDSVTIDAAITWSLHASSAGTSARIGRLVLEAGARLVFGGAFSGVHVTQLTAVGTPDSLVRVESEPRAGVQNLLIAGEAADASQVAFTQFRDSPIDHWRSSTPPVPRSRGAHPPGPTPLVPHSPTRRSIRP